MADYGFSTVVVAVVVGAATVLLGWRRPFGVLTLLLLLVPLRDFSTRWMNVHTPLTVAQVTAIGRWWFVVILALLVLSGARWFLRLRAQRPLPRPAAYDVLLAVAVGLAVLATLLSPNRPAGLLSLRGYLQPMGVYLLARLITPSRRELRTLLTAWLAVGVLMAAFGLWQVIGWDEADYRAEGYIRQNGDLVVPYARVARQDFLRPASTVSGPNELGMDMVLLFLLACFAVLSVPSSLRLALASLGLLFTAGLAVSLSRSAFLGFVAGLLVVVGLHWRALLHTWRSPSSRRKSFLLAAAAVGLTALGLILASTPLFHLVIRTIRSFGSQYHLLDSVQAVEYLLRRPQGVGMGLVEPKGALALIEAGGAYHVEGSIFQIAMEMGVWGLAAWLGFWGATLAGAWRSWHVLQTPELRIVTGTAIAGWLGSLVAFLFLPLMQSISLMCWLWFLLGAGCQSAAWEAAWRSSDKAGPKVEASARPSAEASQVGIALRSDAEASQPEAPSSGHAVRHNPEASPS